MYFLQHEKLSSKWGGSCKLQAWWRRGNLQVIEMSHALFRFTPLSNFSFNSNFKLEFLIA